MLTTYCSNHFAICTYIKSLFDTVLCVDRISIKLEKRNCIEKRLEGNNGKILIVGMGMRVIFFPPSTFLFFSFSSFSCWECAITNL